MPLDRIIPNVIDQLESKKSSTLILRVPTVHHKILRSYGQSIGKSMNYVVAALIEQLVNEVQSQFVINIPSSSVISMPKISEADFAERAKRFACFSEVLLQNVDADPFEYGLLKIHNAKGNNVNHYTLDASWAWPVPVVREPVTGSKLFASPNGHSVALGNPDADPI